MAPWLYSAAAVALTFATRQADADGASKTEWHPPADWDVNNLTKALHSEGVYGFIFDSSHTPDDKYGQYNYCNMPHVRRQEYVKPSEEYELKYVELIHRHHKRTPYASNGFPVEPYRWDCDDQGLYLYGQPFGGGHDAAKGYRKGIISDINPFKPAGWTGSCQFPQITPGGLEDSWQHGADLFGVYHDLLGFLPEEGDRSSKVEYRVTNNVITSQVAGMVVNGMWDTTEDQPLQAQAANIDSLEPQYKCPAGNQLFNDIKSSNNPEWQAHLDQSEELLRALDDISGVGPENPNFHESFDPYFDNLSSRQCHGKSLPCKIEDGANGTTCITQEMADAVYRMGHWEYSQMYRDHPSSLPSSSARYGVWPAELAAHLRDVIAGKRETIYFHNVAHDGSVSQLLSMLQVEKMVWPGMGAEVVFELYEKRRGDESGSSELVRRGGACVESDCLRQLAKFPASASAVCPTYMVATTEALPTWPPGCGSEEMISACSCLDVPAATPTAFSRSSPTNAVSDSGYYIRVLFGGQVLESSSPLLGRIDMIPVDILLGYIDSLVGEKASLVKGNCNA